MIQTMSHSDTPWILYNPLTWINTSIWHPPLPLGMDRRSHRLSKPTQGPQDLLMRVSQFTWKISFGAFWCSKRMQFQKQQIVFFWYDLIGNKKTHHIIHPYLYLSVRSMFQCGWTHSDIDIEIKKPWGDHHFCVLCGFFSGSNLNHPSKHIKT